eukprot:TRINITY_DN18221_c0_g2_i1.p1 TRINITY_DN18221_c0_g2~~TRINITY_DN18221_c0_g2_i1.p1  ORF type:complete len:105 (-),score=28.40 TRINITY_DN18221_c0_g2_i1:55-369(-)
MCAECGQVCSVRGVAAAQPPLHVYCVVRVGGTKVSTAATPPWQQHCGGACEFGDPVSVPSVHVDELLKVHVYGTGLGVHGDSFYGACCIPVLSLIHISEPTRPY